MRRPRSCAMTHSSRTQASSRSTRRSSDPTCAYLGRGTATGEKGAREFDRVRREHVRAVEDADALLLLTE
jgi:hypothetical protein